MLELRVVAIVLRHYPTVAGLEHLVPIITCFIRPSPHLSLRDACTYGSTALMDWIWNASCTSVDDRIPSWSLTNYLRTELHYYRWVFYESMEIAASRGNLEVVKWLFTHFSGCGTPVEVVEQLAQHGHLSVLQFLFEHDAGRRYSSEEKPAMKTFEAQIDSIPVSTVGDAGNLVLWDGSGILEAIRNEQVAVAQWMIEFVPGLSDRQCDMCIEALLNIGEKALAELLLPPGKELTDYLSESSSPNIIEWALNSGRMQSSYRAANAFVALASSDRLDLMQQIVRLHSPREKHVFLRFYSWETALRQAFESGKFPTIRWLLECPSWRKFRSSFKHQKDRREKVFTTCAGMEDRPDITKYIYEQGIDSKYGEMLLNSVQKGHKNTVAWLIEHFPKREHLPDYCVLDISAKYGHLEILGFLQQLEPSTVPGFSLPMIQPKAWWKHGKRTKKTIPAMIGVDGGRSEWLPTDAMDDAAANGHLEVVQWLHTNRSEGCTTAAMDNAATNGHLKVVKWLHTHRSEGCTTAAMDDAAAKGHLDILDWLHENRSEGCTAKAVERAAINDHLEVVQWLVLNTAAECTAEAMAEAMDGAVRQGNLGMVKLLFKTRSECCSAETIDTALKCSHLQVASWLRKLFPEYVPERFYSTKDLEKLLYIHVQYPSICPPGRDGWDNRPFKYAQEQAVKAWLNTVHPTVNDGSAFPAYLPAPI